MFSWLSRCHSKRLWHEYPCQSAVLIVGLLQQWGLHEHFGLSTQRETSPNTVFLRTSFDHKRRLTYLTHIGLNLPVFSFCFFLPQAHLTFCMFSTFFSLLGFNMICRLCCRNSLTEKHEGLSYKHLLTQGGVIYKGMTGKRHDFLF